MAARQPDRAAIQQRVCSLAEEAVAAEAGTIRPDSRWIEDVFDSLDETEFILRAEAEFRVSIPVKPETPEQTAIWGRRPFRMSDFVDLVILQWGTGWTDRSRCPDCGYCLAGLPGNTCPECGHTLSPFESDGPGEPA